jgi:alkylhydroperoxidase family enzyme
MLPIDESRRRAEAAGLNSQFADLSVFRILLHNPAVAREIGNTITALMFGDNVLNARLRELVIMRIGWVTGSQYEWTQHWRVARGLKIPAEDLLAVRDWNNATQLAPADKAVLQATDDTLQHGCIQPETWAACCEHLGSEAERVELVAAIGNWSLIAQLLKSLQVPLEDGVEAWPPDGMAGGNP